MIVGGERWDDRIIRLEAEVRDLERKLQIANDTIERLKSMVDPYVAAGLKPNPWSPG